MPTGNVGRGIAGTVGRNLGGNQRSRICRWPLDVPMAIDDHLSLGNDRPTLSCRVEVGRAYALTSGQRDVIRERYGMTPAQLVEVTEVGMFANTKYIRRITLQSCEHVDVARRHMSSAS